MVMQFNTIHRRYLFFLPDDDVCVSQFDDFKINLGLNKL